MLDLKNKKILVTGGAGFLGTYVVKELLTRGVKRGNIIIPRSKKYDLRKVEDCRKILRGVNVVIHLAANVGGIGYNQKNPGELFYDNAVMGLHLIEEARKAGVKKFVQVGTICSYPKLSPIPFREENLWNGYPEETNAPYGLAKLMLLTMIQAYRQQYKFNGIYLLPVNLYGPGDNFDRVSSHVIPALIRKFVDAKINQDKFVEVWGSGKPTREFLYVSDAARGIVDATEKYSESSPVNLGNGKEISIKDLVDKIRKIVDYEGKIVWNTDKPDGQPRRVLDTKKAMREFGFKASVDFESGIKKTINWYIQEKIKMLEKLKVK